MDDTFRVLALPDTATCEQVRKAYLRLAEVHHPDKGGSAASFVVLQAAYNRAMKLCKEPVPCDTCEGEGFIERAAGWSVARIICAGCGGKGTVPRV